MPTIIDSLVVTLGLDPSQFKQQVAESNAALAREKDLALKRGREIEGSAKKQREAFGTLKGAALGYLSALVGAGSAGAFLLNTTKTDAAVGRLSATLAVSTEEISTWQAVMRETGGSTEDANAALQTLVDLNTKYRTARLSPMEAGLLSRLGVTPEDLQEPTRAALAMAEAFERLDPRIAADYARQLGFSPAYINTIIKGRAALEEHIRTAKEHGAITREDAAAAAAFQKSLEGLKTATVSAGRGFMQDLLPGLTLFIDRVTKFVEGPSWAKFLQIGKVKPGSGFLPGDAFLPSARRPTAQTPGAPARPAPAQFLSYGGLITPPSIMSQFTTPAPAAARAGAGGRGTFAGAVAFFRSQGYTEAQARGMAAGMQAENDTLDPGRANPKSGAYGIGQWMTARRNDFKEWSGGKDIKGSTWEEQLAFMTWELKNTENVAGNAIRNAKTEEEALRLYVGSSGGNGVRPFGFMRPAAGGEVEGDLRRGKRALASNPAGGNSTTVTIGTVTVQTQATDAKGVAGAIGSELQRSVAAANRGMQ